MIGEHEIPAGSNLYFGNSAKLKRTLEARACEILELKGFEEIVTPCFAFENHGRNDIKESKNSIRFSDRENNHITLRTDSSLDVIRLITKRLGRSTTHKKWFYIQPIFEYPSSEINQIGVEFMDYDSDSLMIKLATEILTTFNLSFVIQLSNSEIPKLASMEAGVDYNLFLSRNITKIKASKIEWLNELVNIETVDDAIKATDKMPLKISVELNKLVECAKSLNLENTKIDPLYVSNLGYYSGIFFRVFQDNEIYIKGGAYKAAGKDTFGFAVYTDTVIKQFEMEKKDAK